MLSSCTSQYKNKNDACGLGLILLGPCTCISTCVPSTTFARRLRYQRLETQSEILRPSGASPSIHTGAGRPTFRLTGGSRGVFVKKTILKKIHVARLRGSL